MCPSLSLPFPLSLLFLYLHLQPYFIAYHLIRSFYYIEIHCTPNSLVTGLPRVYNSRNASSNPGTADNSPLSRIITNMKLARYRQKYQNFLRSNSSLYTSPMNPRLKVVAMPQIPKFSSPTKVQISMYWFSDVVSGTMSTGARTPWNECCCWSSVGVGVAGLILGGVLFYHLWTPARKRLTNYVAGYSESWKTNQYRMAIDTVTAYELVTASSRREMLLRRQRIRFRSEFVFCLKVRLFRYYI